MNGSFSANITHDVSYDVNIMLIHWICNVSSEKGCQRHMQREV